MTVDAASHPAADLSPLKRAYVALEQLQAKCRDLEQARSEPIAVVGMACRLPGGADSPEAYWRLLRAGDDAVCDVPADRWDVDAYYDPDPAAAGKMCTRAGGYLRERVDAFDPQFFGISPREAESMDPQHRLLLEVAWEALENAAQIEDRLAGSSTGVFVGITSHDYADLHLPGHDLRSIATHIITGNTHNAAAGRLSYCFGFQGPCLAVDTACSSSLVSIHLACKSLLLGECRRALAGGVNLILSPVATIALSQGRVLAPDGCCRAFDAAASGMVRGEGCAIVVLKRLSHALADRDNILALICSTAVNQDGPSSGLTVPNGPAQEVLIRHALASVDLKPGDIDYVEAHGTGTLLGDPIELRALAGVFASGRERPLFVGSVKTNIGHLEACAGVAGLIKVVLALQHGEIPPHLHFRDPTPHVAWDELPFVVPTETRPWPSGSRSRRAGVSSFGFSGVNAHVVLQEAPEVAPPLRADNAGRAKPSAKRPLHLLALSGRTKAALRQTAHRFAEHLERHGDVALGDVCFSAGVGRSHASHRLGMVAGSLDEARAKLAAFLEGRSASGLEYGVSATPPKVAFLFTGQGSQYFGMGRELYETQPLFRRTLQRCNEILRPHLRRSLSDVLYVASTQACALHDTAYAQPALFAVDYALAELWQSWGVRPAVVLGHSLGEYVAACVAGVFSLEDGLKLVAERARLMQDLPRDGAMFAVFAAPAEVERMIAPHALQVCIAAYNGPNNVVISGGQDAVAALAAQWQAAGVRVQRLAVSHAFHSHLMDPILDEFESKVRQLSLAVPRIALISNLDGALASRAITNAGYWRRHLREPVRFARGLDEAHAKGCSVFLELGPKPTLLGLAQQCLEGEDLGWLPSLRPGLSDWQQMLASLASFYVRGARVDWPGFERDYQHRRVALPTTPFQRQRYWLESRSQAHDGAFLGPGSRRAHPLLGSRLSLAGTQDICYQSRISRDDPVFLQDHAVFEEAVLPASAYLEMAVAAACAAFDADGAVLENVAFQHALRLPERETKTLQTVLRPQGADAYAFEIYSRSDDQPGESWVRHAAGSCRRAEMSAAAPQDLASLAGKAVDVDLLYRRARTCGVDLGPKFQALRRAWRRDAVALGEIALPETLLFGAGDYRLHPVLLDAAFQAMGAVFADQDGPDLFLPVAVDRLHVHRRAGTNGWSRVCVESIRVGREQGLRVDVQVLAVDGQQVAVLEGLQLKRTSRERVLASGAPAFADWLYGMEWLPKETEDSQSRPDYLPGAEEISASILPKLVEAFAEPPELEHFGAFLDDVEHLTVDYIVAALRGLGWSLLPGQRASTAALFAQLGIADRHRRLFARFLGILAEAGVLENSGSSDWEVCAAASSRGALDGAETLASKYPTAVAELTLLRRCGDHLAAVLTGECDPLGLLFPEDGSVTAANLYGDSPGARAANGFVHRVVTSLLERLTAGRTVRMLEIGAGTGGTTTSLLHALPADATEYTFTDVSPLFVHRAAERFRTYPFVRCAVLDIETPPAAQGLEPHAYDLVVAANVVHATRDLRASLRHVRELLAPSGLLVLLEGTTPLRFIDLIFGLTEGWWRFADSDVRPTHPLLSADRWQSLLEDCGFRHAGTVASSRASGGTWSTQALIIAQAEERAAVAAQGEPKHWLVLAPEHAALSTPLLQRIEAVGDVATLVHPSDTYRSFKDGAARIDPADPAHFRRLLDEMRAEGIAPARIVHLWGLSSQAAADFAAGDPKQADILGWETALHLVQAVINSSERAPPELWLVTRGAQHVGDRRELPGVAQATLFGFGKVVNLECPEMRCVGVDLDDGDEEGAAQNLFDEIRRGSSEDLVAFRGGRRHVARLVRHPDAGERPGFAIRPDGTYLITGGLQGLGLTTAKWLVQHGARSLVLVGRRDAGPETSQDLTELRRTGAVVEPVRADVSDAGQVARVLAHIEAHLPPLRGIVHSAGVLDDGTLAQQTAERFRRVLAPKMLGAWHLHVLTRGQPLDFFVLYSSMASLLGSAGQANHAAANAFLDALAHHRQGLGLPALSINWGVWSEIGAAVRHNVGARVKTQGFGTISPQQGMQIFEHLLARPSAQVGVVPIDWSLLAHRSGGGRHSPFFSFFSNFRARHSAGIVRPQQSLDRKLELAAASPAERGARVAAYLCAEVAAVLRLAAHDVDMEQPLNRIGLDSLMAVELRNRLRSQVGLDVPLVTFMDDTSIAHLASELSLRLAQTDPDSDRKVDRSDIATAQEAEPLLARLDELTDEEVDALLGAALAEQPHSPIPADPGAADTKT
jgi:acyl transferase domain-containing protein